MGSPGPRARSPATSSGSATRTSSPSPGSAPPHDRARRRPYDRLRVLVGGRGGGDAPGPAARRFVLLHPDGSTLAEGHHRGAGTAHAEADALSQAGSAARGATAVVTLEPCNHTGRAGPCAQALLAAGVARVVHAQAEPNPTASGGADTLRNASVDVAGLLEQPPSAAVTGRAEGPRATAVGVGPS